MEDCDKTKDELIEELVVLREKLVEFSTAHNKVFVSQDAPRQYDLHGFPHESRPIACQTLDEKGRFLEVNQAWINMTGYSRGEVVGKWFGDFLCPAYREPFEICFSKFKKASEIQDVALQITNKDGVEIPVCLEGRILHDQKSNLKRFHCTVHDVSAASRSEQEPKGNQEMMLIALEGARLGIWDWDLIAGKAIWSYGTHGMLGYKTDEFHADLKNWKRLVHPDDWQKVANNLNLLMKGKATRFNVEYRIRDKSGDWVWTEVKGSVVQRDEAGSPVRMTGIVADVTDRKKAEEAIKVSEQRYRTLVETSFDGIFLQKGTTIVFANERLHEMLGYEQGELVGKNHWIVYHPDDRPMTRARAQARLRGEIVTERYEVRLQTKDGTVLNGEIRAKAFKFGEQLGIQVWVRDISEEKRAKEKFQTLVENVPFGTIIIEHDGKLGYVSPQVKSMFGYSPDEIPRGSDWMEKAYPNTDYRKKVTETWIGDLKDAKPGQQRPRIFTVTCKDGTLKDVLFRPVQLSTGEHLMTLEDVTIMKRAQDELRRLNRTLRTLSECNQALVRAPDEATLVGDLCRILVDQGRYRAAWIGFSNRDEPDIVRLVAHYGFDLATLKTDVSFWDMREIKSGPIMTVITTGQPVITRGPSSDSALGTSGQRSLRIEQDSSLMLSLKRENRVLGVLAVYSTDSNAFDAAEVNLLTQLADDLSYGITALRIRVEKDRVESEMRETYQLLESIIEFLPDATFVIDKDKRVIAWNRACENLTGVNKQALLGCTDYAYAEPFFGERRPILIDFLDPSNQELEAQYKYVSRRGRLIFAESFISSLRDGQGAHLWGVAAPLFDLQGRRCGAIEVIRDVTEQKQVEKALRENELRYRMLFETAGDAILLMRHDRFIDCNSQTLALFACRRDQMVGASPSEFSPPRQPDGSLSEEKALEKINLALTEGPQLFEWEHCRFDRTPFTAEVSLNRIDLDGDTLVQAIVRDITERKMAEKRLAESERKYRELVENANSIILRWSHDGRITFLNEFGQKFFGYSGEEILGRHVVGTIVPVTDTDGHDLAPLMDRILQDPRAFERNVKENMKRDGKRVTVAWTNKIVPDVQGRGSEVLSVGIDITELKRAQEEIRRKNEELHSINRIIAASTGFIDLEAVLQTVLDEVVNLVGLEGAQVCLMTADNSLILSSRRAPPESAIQEALNTGSVRVGDCLCGTCAWTFEPLILRNQGEVLSGCTHFPGSSAPIQFHASFPLITASKCVGVLCVFSETEKKPADDRLRLVGTVTEQLALAIENAQLYEAVHRHASELERTVAARTRQLADAKERAETADRIKSAFLATMSHELRTPLNSIIGFTGIILKGLAGPLTSEQTKQLEMVRSSARHLLALINDVLDISKIEAGQLEVAHEPFDLCSSLRKVLDIVKPLAEKKDLKLLAEVAPEVNMAVGDQRRVEQILLNLLNNAIKFTEEGEVRLTVKLIDDFIFQGGVSGHPAIQHRVSDTGIGIRPEDLTTLFQPFRQIESGISRSYEGTGLGLAICRRLAGLMGGEITAESTWGVGSTFIFTCPVKRWTPHESTNPPDRR